MKQNTKKQNFSMIELTVVSAVMLTVVSIIFSSIKTSSDLSKKVTCMSNLSQIRAYTELYRKDHAMLPYSDIWLTDFSYASDYMNGNDGLSVFICPGSDDEPLTDTSQLTQNTSYYYVPAKAVLEQNMADGHIYGFSLLNLNSLADKNQLVIYDKSSDHHNGKINIAYLYGDDTLYNELEGQITDVHSETVLSLDGSGELVLEDAETYGTLSINPARSTGNLFTLTDPEGNVITVRDSDGGSTGQAININLKVKGSERELSIGDDSLTLRTNTTYDITATATEEGQDPYYIYELTQESGGMGNWFIDIFQGVGAVTVTNTETGEAVVLGD